MQPGYRVLFSSVETVSGLSFEPGYRGVVMLDLLPDETEVEFWIRQNKEDEAIGLYCQSCCFRYSECIDKEWLHPYDRAAESCPDFIPKDMYKGKARANCWKMRLQHDPDYDVLPEGDYFHPHFVPFILCSPVEYYMIITKEKAMRFLKELKKKEQGC